MIFVAFVNFLAKLELLFNKVALTIVIRQG
jgi:hypothetical protein